VSDARTGQSCYAVALEIAPEEMARLDGAELIPGMPIEAFLQTGDRPVLSYLLRPLADHLRRAFREG
jgi:HlyD family secretion protein